MVDDDSVLDVNANMLPRIRLAYSDANIRFEVDSQDYSYDKAFDGLVLLLDQRLTQTLPRPRDKPNSIG